MNQDAAIQEAIEILEGPDAEKILRESMRDLEALIDLGLIEVNVAFTLQQLKTVPVEIRNATDLDHQFGSQHTAQNIVEAARRITSDKETS